MPLASNPESFSLSERELDDDVVLSVRNVSKRFCKNLRRSMAYGIGDLGRNLVGMPSKSTELRRDEFWALQDVNFELRRGEALGLIGPNGSGKSTLLRMIAGIFPPDAGEIAVRGRVGALIALGAGFHPHMSGRENIYLNGAILGMTREEISEKYDRIVDFSEIGDFIDAPVAGYSSGMRVRLGFSIAAQVDPDVLLIDEVLAVGDVGFRAKCYNAIHDICHRAAVVFVSHSMPAVDRICSRCMALQEGRLLVESNNVSEAIDMYMSLFTSAESKMVEFDDCTITDISLACPRDEVGYSIRFGSPLTVSFDARISGLYPEVEAYISFLTLSQDLVAQCSSIRANVKLSNLGEGQRFRVTIPNLNLSPSHYYMSIGLRDAKAHRILSWHHSFARLRVIGDFHGNAPVQMDGAWETTRE